MSEKPTGYIYEEDFRRLVLSCYVGNKCEVCSKEYSSVEILEESDPVAVQNDEDGLKFACKKCYKKD